MSAIGNAISVAPDDALGGLRRGTLKIFADEYVFSFHDAGTKAVHKWSPSVGAKHFTIAEAELPQEGGRLGRHLFPRGRHLPLGSSDRARMTGAGRRNVQ